MFEFLFLVSLCFVAVGSCVLFVRLFVCCAVGSCVCLFVCCYCLLLFPLLYLDPRYKQVFHTTRPLSFPPRASPPPPPAVCVSHPKSKRRLFVRFFFLRTFSILRIREVKKLLAFMECYTQVRTYRNRLFLCFVVSWLAQGTRWMVLP